MNADDILESDNVESDSCDNDESTRTSKSFYGKNNFKWSADEFVSKNTRTARHNIITQTTLKVLGDTANPSDIWNIFFTDSILSEVLNWTNVKIDSVRQKYKQKLSFTKNIDEIELRSLFGLLYFSAVFKSNHESAGLICY